ncbi:penicillin-insensitive murein endopeptidase [Massilia sp. Leaf139]|uniref:penicillin-insensitive murein endopeptidase n=1 Tax=Massilia sp. Leaf139 TaxID=1736272 RepID=UPI0006F64E1E|nr:penicillin-insensitive murein endopeptidase [Massilia sp. Leaf139]KQQ89189.1 peptidase [Massilia sp. Leaf139]
MTAGARKQYFHNLFLLLAVGAAPAQASTCYGRVAQGSIAGAVALPDNGSNFEAYSRLGVSLGRTYVHERVREVMTDAYALLAQRRPATRYVYGETGLAKGGRMRPHRTHQNGLSVDFMVPVVDAGGRSVALPSSPLNKFGYGLEFDERGRADGLRIDYAAMADHLHALSEAARNRKVGIKLVIFEPALMPALFATARGAALRKLPFMRGKPWVRHDEHYHVDFAVPCEPLPVGGARPIKAR